VTQEYGERRGGIAMRVALEINFALWGMIFCIALKAMHDFAIL
jgi:hypothetical protein